MDLRFRFITGVDKKAIFPLAYLIHSYVQNHRNVGCTEICANDISFTKGIVFTIGRISYVPYGLECRNGIIFYDGSMDFSYPKDSLFTYLVNALAELSPCNIAKIPL